MAVVKHLSKADTFSFDPQDLTILGVDTGDQAGDNPAFDERAFNPIQEHLLRSILRDGVLQPVTVKREGRGDETRFVVVAGRQRTLHARAANLYKQVTIAAKQAWGSIHPQVELLQSGGGVEVLFGCLAATCPKGWERLKGSKYVRPLSLPALAANLKEAGGDLDCLLVTVPAKKFRGDDRATWRVMTAENSTVVSETILQKAQKAGRALSMGMGLQEVAEVFGVVVATVRQWLTLLEATPAVLAALAEDKLSSSAAIELAGMARAKQDAALKDLLRAAQGQRITASKVTSKRAGQKPKKDGRASRVKHSSLAAYARLAIFHDLSADAQAMALWILDPKIDPSEFAGELRMALQAVRDFGEVAVSKAAEAKEEAKRKAIEARARSRQMPTEPESSPEPEPTEPESSPEPEPTEPESSPEPEPTEPEITEPEPTEPEITEPEPTEPEITEPEPSPEPEPSAESELSAEAAFLRDLSESMEAALREAGA